MLPSVSAQKPDVIDPSGSSVDFASLDETLTAIPLENALSVDLIQPGYRRFPENCQPIGPGIGGLASEVMPGLPGRQLPGRSYRVLWPCGELRRQVGRQRRVFPHQRD